MAAESNAKRTHTHTGARRAVVVGGTGAVGLRVLSTLLSSPEWTKVCGLGGVVVCDVVVCGVVVWCVVCRVMWWCVLCGVRYVVCDVCVVRCVCDCAAQVTTIGRREVPVGENGKEKLTQHVIDMDHLADRPELWQDHDVVFCCLGTTRGQVLRMFEPHTVNVMYIH